MITSLNRLLFRPEPVKLKPNLSSTKYPSQDLTKLGKIIQLRTSDYQNDRELVSERYLYSYKDDKYNHNYLSHAHWFRIMRFDLDEPHRAILINERGTVLVVQTSDIDYLLDPPIDLYGGIYMENIPLIFRGCDILLQHASTIEQFKDPLLNTNKLHLLPFENKEYKYLKVYTEYMTDVNDPNISLDDVPEINRSRDEFTEQYGRADVPRRAINRGVVVRFDESFGKEYIVVVEERDGKLVFVCDDEAMFYFDTDNLEFEDTLVDNMIIGGDII